MTAHISARLAWHMDGWNGSICRDPAANVYCVGQYSYPGPVIREKRDLAWETRPDVAGRACADLSDIPPCVYSINAFGSRPMTASADIPEWMYQQGSRKEWAMPPATISIWPYEQMYRDEVSSGSRYGGKYDNDKRLQFAKDYFSKVEADRSLVFYYSNYSNPFSTEEVRRYVLIGVSRVKKLGDFQFHEDVPREIASKYGGAYVWQMNVTSHYPEQGLRLPYHRYADEPDKLQRLLLVPDNARDFKFATRHITDDGALDLVEQFLQAVGALKEFGDTTENWSIREQWLHTLIAELWDARGVHPGLPAVLDLIGFGPAIPFVRAAAAKGQGQGLQQVLFAFLNGRSDLPPGLNLNAEDVKRLVRNWKLRSAEERRLLEDVFPRFDLTADQIERILSESRGQWSVRASLTEIVANPYRLAEEFVGDGPDDTISFNKIDHGVLPSPELGASALADVDDWRRLRALCVSELRANQKDVFVAAPQVIHEVNRRLSYLPDWKRHQFTERYLEVDEAELAEALTIRQEGQRRWIYLKHAHENERLIEAALRQLAARPEIALRTPLTDEHWRNFLHNPQSQLAARAPSEYAAAIEGQVQVCKQAFPHALSVISGAAGTGKTTVVNAILQAIERTDGVGASIQLLAPTGKAAQRLREITGRRHPTATIHSFLAQRGWLNKNLTFRPEGGEREEGVATYVIDEASMLSLEILATLIRAIQWQAVRRLILVGDPNQVPPLGRGRAFADIIDWLASADGSVGKLDTNLRQMENRVAGRGTALLDLARVFVRRSAAAEKDEAEEAQAEITLKRVQEGGEVDQDLRVAFWRDSEDLRRQLVALVVTDMQSDSGVRQDPARPWELWRAAFGGTQQRPEYLQVISPYRGEVFGVDNLNLILQEAAQGRRLAELRTIDEIALYDKVIQVHNRPRSDRIWAYDYVRRVTEQIEIYNGYLGFVRPHGFDAKKVRWSGFSPKRFQVTFSSEPNYWVGFGGELGKATNGKWMPHESVAENLELAYAISVHKAQGSEFDRVYLVIPKGKRSLLSRELLYTGLTRATRHCTLLVEADISPLLSMRRLEQSHLARVNASLFSFAPVPDDLRVLGDWYEEGKIHTTLAEHMVRSKSEVIITNLLFERDIPFKYEVPLFASDGTFYLPDFTVTWNGEDWYWEHLGRMDDEKYRSHWETKRAWYDKFFPGRMLVTTDGGTLTRDAENLIRERFS